MAKREMENRQNDRDTDIIECDLFLAPTQHSVHLYKTQNTSNGSTPHSLSPTHTHPHTKRTSGVCTNGPSLVPTCLIAYGVNYKRGEMFWLNR